MKTCLIKQPAGLGDIIFCQKIASAILKTGYKVYWPVVDHYQEIASKYMNRESVVFCREDDDFPMKNYYLSNRTKPLKESDTENVYLPLMYSDLNFPEAAATFNIMKVKYKTVGMDHQNWQDHVTLKRDLERENYLFYDVLKLSDEIEYNVVNRWFGTTWDGYRKDMDIKSNLPIVEMKNLGFDNIFDWCKVFENASEIHTVDTAICYILEKLDLKADRKCWYTRNLPEKGYSYVEDVYTNTNWEFIL